ncbi:protein DGCR6-like isoform X1 [Penaeus japonicus]|uniref:protein DGCR6-like isoform X1 n=1 Tax=Penaeus japonicus TaxID=27405 RepID=UPI001C70BEBF|nr:protein DGCR6-like isoform X1 [Penaeus japonicus]
MHSAADNSSDTQERLYKMLEKLQSLAREIPQKYQQRLPYDLLSSLAHVLLDNTVFEIVRELAELQHMTEKSLHQQRTQMMHKHKTDRETLIKSQKDEIQSAECQGKTHVASRLPRLHQEQLSQLEARHAQEMSTMHVRILQLLDQKVTEQQSTLQQVGVPGFHETENPVEIKIQMYIMDFIVKIGGIKIP